MSKTAKRKVATKKKTRKNPSLLVLQKENFHLRKKLERLSTRSMQPDEAYNLNKTQLKKQRKEFMDLIANWGKK